MKPGACLAAAALLLAAACAIAPLPGTHERGPDLSQPACALQLEMQITAVLAAHGEAPEDAAGAAADALDSFGSGEDAVAFVVATPSGEYAFGVRRKGTHGCVLRLHGVTKFGGGKNYSWDYSHVSFDKRPLPACVCGE